MTGSRRDVVLRGTDAVGELFHAGVPLATIDALDTAFVGRVDLFAHLRGPSKLSMWTVDRALIGAELVTPKRRPLFIARYAGALAPEGFYDADGNAMRGEILARPVPLSRITSHFGTRFDAISGELAQHHGIDYGVPVGTPVVAVGDGRVTVAGSSPTAGNFIEIKHARGYESRYLHLSAIDPAVHVGAVVHQGQVIGLSGNTGRSTGPHLHYELHVAGIPLDPLATLALPVVALGPTARREHLAFIQQLEAQHDGRADEQDEHP